MKSLWENPINDKEGVCWNFKIAEATAVLGRGNPKNDYEKISELTISLSGGSRHFRLNYYNDSACNKIPVYPITIDELIKEGFEQIDKLKPKKNEI